MTPLLDALSPEFLVTALVVVLIPGTGVIYTLSTGLFRGPAASVAAAFGCTLGIVPHLTASVLGLAALLHASALAFQTVKIAGILYLLYLAWGMWRESGGLALSDPRTGEGRGGSARRGWSWVTIAVRGILLNILNPKLSLFFLAFLPQFVPAHAPDTLARMGFLGGVFMLMTFVVFVGYGLGAAVVRDRVLSSARLTRWIQRAFAAAFAGFAARLAVSE